MTHPPPRAAPWPRAAPARGVGRAVDAGPGSHTLAGVGSHDVVVRDRLSADEIAAVSALVDAATERDGVRPLSDQSMLHLRSGGDGRSRSVLLRDADGILVGYGHLDPGEEPGGELVVHPAHRRRGYGGELARAMLTETGDRLRLWAHGGSPAATALAASLGLERVRTLMKMRRPLADPLPDVTLPVGVRVRAFEVGRDERNWIALNRRAFADHPEQGALTLDDLTGREREPWFDPAGFFLAERDDGTLVGFHWTKVHDDTTGEVYVVGVDPSAQGTGLGRALTLAGLRHLRSLGLSQVMLYVDEDNAGAVRLYETLGFALWSADVMYGRAAR